MGARSPSVTAVVIAAVGACAGLRYPAERLDRRPIASTRVLDRDGRLLDELPSERGGYGTWVSLDDVAPALIDATIAGEDENFYAHHGVDPEGIARAVELDARAGRLAYGGSTITQQLAKLLDPAPRNVLGKLVEAVDAFRLEATLSKREILEQYLNRAYYGRQATGVEAAADRFFGKRARDLSPDEAVLLAVLPRSPARYDPARHPEAARARRAHVLSLLVARGQWTAVAARAAAAAPIRLVAPPTGREAPHLLDWIAVHHAAPRGAPEVCTTVDLGLQARLERRLRAHLATVADRDVGEAGLVVVDDASGDVLAMIGSRRYDDARRAGAVNAVTALRHPGSTLKPFAYALALEDGASPATPVLDVPTTFRGYAPAALDHRFRGVVSMRDALGSSLNVPATRVAAQVGPERLARLLRDAGMRSVDPARGHVGAALPLGSVAVPLLELAEAYTTLAEGGVHRPLRIVVPCGARAPPPAATRVLSAESTYLVTRMLADASARRRVFGVETPLELPFDVAVKTGTSQAYVDDVVVGYSRERTVAVWAGNFDGHPTRGVLSMDGAAPLFRDAMLAVHEHGAPAPFVAPPGIATVELCPLSGMLRGPHCPAGRREEVARDHAPIEPCTWHAADGTHLPAEVRALAPDPSADAAPGDGRDVEILGPVDGTHFVVDPTLPRTAQRLTLRVAVRARGVARVRWLVDDAVVADVGAPFAASWPLALGAHRIRALAVSASGDLHDDVAVYVAAGDSR